MSVVISDEIIQASRLSPNEFRLEIALYLFQTGRLTQGYASQLAEMPLNAFRSSAQTAKHFALLIRC